MKQLLLILSLLVTSTAWSQEPFPDEWVGRGEGKVYVLYRKHDVKAMSQGKTPACVGCAAAKALEVLHGQKFSAEWLYAVSRDENNPIWNGSQPSWAAQVATEIGALPSMNYPVFGYDLSVYDPGKVKAWQSRGPPRELDAIASFYRSAGYIKITSWEQLRDCIAQGIPVTVGSPVGFGGKSGRVRSSSGMLRSRWWSRWNHAMLFIGVGDGKSKRSLVLNSWGTKWISGPRWLGDEPGGSFWVSKRDAELMISGGGAYAILPIPGLE